MDDMKIDWGPAADVRAPAPEIVIIPDFPAELSPRLSAELCPELGPVAKDAPVTVAAPVPAMPMSAPVVVPAPTPLASVPQTPPSPQPNNRLGLGVGIGVGVVAAALTVWGAYVALGAASSAVSSAWDTATRTLPWLLLLIPLWVGARVARVRALGATVMAREAARSVGQLARGAGAVASGVGRASAGAVRLATGQPARAHTYATPAATTGWRARVAGVVAPQPVAVAPEVEWVDEDGNPVPVGTPVAWDARGNPSQWAGVALSAPVAPSPTAAGPESMTRGAAVLTRLFGAPDAQRGAVSAVGTQQVADTRDPSMDWSFADWLFDEDAQWNRTGDGQPSREILTEWLTDGLTERWIDRMRSASPREEVHGAWAASRDMSFANRPCRFCAVGLLYDESDPNGWVNMGTYGAPSFMHRDREKMYARYGRDFLMRVSDGFENEGWSMNNCAAFVEAHLGKA
jgi:X-X-X-Leu-X-X-Gly heptad repeat protein